MITRHILTIPADNGSPERRVHYRKCGSGPVLLLVHQSPRSSKEYEPLMRAWAAHFTCIAPDSPGFGQSDPLPGDPDIDSFAAATLRFLDVLGVRHCHGYGFHSGSIILAHALKQQPHRFSALAIGGYPIWTAAEIALLGERYTLPLVPSAYGEHLAWLWNRVLEQAWFFPWFDVREEARMRQPHADPEVVHAIVMELLDAGDAYRAGYRAALSAPPWVPAPGDAMPPVFIGAYAGDPLQDHLDRLPALPPHWRTGKAPDPAAHQADCLAFLRAQRGAAAPAVLAEDAGEGFIAVDDGLIHWKGTPGAARMILHAPASELADPGPDMVAVDVPGHGLSDPATDFAEVLREAAMTLGVDGMLLPQIPAGDPALLYPDLAPQRFGEHLQRTWGIARAEALFAPWYAASAAHAIAIDAGAITPEAIAVRTRARLRAGTAARDWHEALVTMQQ